MAQGFSERVRWSGKTWYLNELVNRFGNQFPIIINTTSGFYGANEVEVISAGEVLRVHSLVTQRRVFVRDVRGRIFSLPLNLTVKFETLKDNGKKSRPKRLDEILEDSELPIRIAFAATENASFNVGEMRYDSGKLGTLTLYKLYEETFLRVNSIARGAIDKNVILLPLYVQIQVSVAKGFKDGRTEDWESLMQMYDRSIGQSKITNVNGLDDILVYDRTDGSILNPQAIAKDMSSGKDVKATSMLIRGFESGKGHDSLTGRLSAFKIGGNKDSNRMAKSFTEYRDNTVNILRYGNKNANLTVVDLPEDKPVFSEPEARTWNRKRSQNKSSHLQKSRSSQIKFSSPTDVEIQLENESNQVTVLDKVDGEEREINIQANIETHDSDRKALDSVAEEFKLEENLSDVQLSRPKPLERPILAQRTFAPTGRVSPMVKVSANATHKAAIVINTENVNQTDERTHGEDFISNMSGSSALQLEKRQSRRTFNAEQRDPFSDSEVIDIRKLDNNNRSPTRMMRFSQSTEEFGDTLNRPPSKSKKKSALKAGRRRSTRTKRHVSYSDTDTVYPVDSHDDMADESEVDSPFYSNTPTVFAENWRSRSVMAHSRNLYTLPANRGRQTGSLVVNVLPVSPPSVRRKNSLPMTRKHFDGFDISAASFRYPSVGVIPEVLEEYQTMPTGSVARQYDPAASRVRTGDLDTHRKYGSSVINVGNVRSEGGMTSRKRNMEPAIISVGDNSFSAHDSSSRRRTNSSAATSNRKPPFEQTPLRRNGGPKVVPLTDYGQPLYNFTNHPTRTAESHKNFGGKVIRLNGTRDGNMWDEISDYEVEKADMYSRTTSVRSPESNYLARSSTMGRARDGSTGINYPSPSIGNGKNHLTYLSTPGLVSTLVVQIPDRGRGVLQGRAPSIYGETRDVFSNGTMPRIYKDNQNVTRKIGVVAPNVVLIRK